jgi:hypothetical protein
MGQYFHCSQNVTLKAQSKCFKMKKMDENQAKVKTDQLINAVIDYSRSAKKSCFKASRADIL